MHRRLKCTALAVVFFAVVAPAWAVGPKVLPTEYDPAFYDGHPYEFGLLPLEELVATNPPCDWQSWSRTFAIRATPPFQAVTGVDDPSLLSIVLEKVFLSDYSYLFLREQGAEMGEGVGYAGVFYLKEEGKELAARLFVEVMGDLSLWVVDLGPGPIGSIESVELIEAVAVSDSEGGGTPTCDNPGDGKKSGCVKILDGATGKYTVRCGGTTYYSTNNPKLFRSGNGEVIQECTKKKLGGLIKVSFFITVRPPDPDKEGGSSGGVLPTDGNDGTLPGRGDNTDWQGRPRPVSQLEFLRPRASTG